MPIRERVAQSLEPLVMRYHAFYDRHASTMLGVLGGAAIAIAIVLTIVALDVRATNNETDRKAQASCERSMRLAPALADDYRDRRVFERKYGEVEGKKRLYEAYATIPKHC